MDRYDTDVVIVGSGGAGLRAAIAAAQEGQRVLVVSKCSTGLASSTLLSGGVYASGGFGTGTAEHEKNTLETGYFLNNPQLVRTLSEEAPQRIRELWVRGAAFTETGGGVVSDGIYFARGRSSVEVLLQWARQVGVEMMDWTCLAELITIDGRAAGFTAITAGGKLFEIRAGAVVLCTGGASALFRFHDNPVTNIGDGYAIAETAGARLQGMEFIQFYPLATGEPGLPRIILLAFFAERGRIVNDRGEDIIEKYGLSELRPIAVRARDQLTRAMVRELRSGRGVYLDLRTFSERDWASPLSANMRPVLEKRFRCSERPFAIIPVAHHTMGGLVVDTDGRTTLPGLFAAGEAVWGVHGANRMGGNGLTETLVFGHRAGSAAALCALRHRDLARTRLERTYFKEPPLSGDGLPPSLVLKTLKDIMWDCCGPVRDKRGLSAGIREVERLEKQPFCCRDSTGLSAAVAVRSALLTAKAILKAALERKQNVGAHFREDGYP